jgi:mercuric ion transport protein
MRSAIAGSLGSTFAALCCAGVPAVLGALSAAGLGFLINDLILFPLLAISLGLALWGLGAGARRHGRRPVLLLGAAGTALMVAGIFVSAPLVYAGAALMLGVSLWNALLLRSAKRAGRAS